MMLSLDEARVVVHQVYSRFLDREPDPGGLQTYTEHLLHGMAVREFVKAITQSHEYDRRLESLDPHGNSAYDTNPTRRVETMFWDIFGRLVTVPDRDHYAYLWMEGGSPYGPEYSGMCRVARILVESAEYADKWGDDHVPHDVERRS
jgi:hypothetical protein